MEDEISAIVNLLGEKNVDNLKTEIKDIFVERVRNDLEEWDEYLISPDDLQAIVDEVIDECKEEIKPLIKNKLLDKILSQVKL